MVGRRCPGRISERDGLTKTCPIVLTDGRTHCITHRPVYGPAHQRLRAKWQGIINRKPTYCAQCQTLLIGRAWHLGHTDDRTDYVGPLCVPCNTRDGARRRTEG